MEDLQNSRILLVDDEEGIRVVLEYLLRKAGYLVDTATGHPEAMACLEKRNYDLAFLDIKLIGKDGLQLLRDLKAIAPSTQVVMFTGSPEVDTAAEAIRQGACDYITKPIDREALLMVCRRALLAKRLEDERELYRANLDAIFCSVADPILMVDGTGRLAQANPPAAQIFGYTEAMIGCELDKISLPCAPSCHPAIGKSLRTQKPQELLRIECHTVTGETRIVNLKVNPISSGNNGGVVVVIQDDTRLVELERSLHQRGNFHGIIGVSPPMQRVFALIEALADMPTTVLIYGESGTGKESVAAALHSSGRRAAAPLVKVNCSALSESLLESELFGHVRGAFTGAIADKVGRFQKADGGTLFLDEIGDISPTVQMRLLRVLQEGEFEPVGASTPIKVDVRIIAATNKDLAEMVRQGTFREDLYYRLNVVRLVLPSLRERLEDLDLLVSHFISKHNARLKKDIHGISADVMQLFHHYRWPGNVRELEHAIEHACILSTSGIICLSDLPADLTGNKAEEAMASQLTPAPAAKLTITEALALAGGNKSQTAKLLGISRRTLYRHLEKAQAGKEESE